MTNSGKLFADDLTEWLIEAGLIQYQCQISMYYKYAPDRVNIVVQYSVNDFVYWYTSEALEKRFVESLVKIFRIKFL